MSSAFIPVPLYTALKVGIFIAKQNATDMINKYGCKRFECINQNTTNEVLLDGCIHKTD